jgi:hypothetical protein
MGRVRRNGYIFEWWTGDHPPRHIHVSDGGGKFLGRIAIDSMKPLDAWHPARKVRETIQELILEGRL